MTSPLDLLKNPFLMGASPLLALNPQLYAAQLANLQAAQLMLANQQLAAASSDSGLPGDRKRPADLESPLDLGPRPKYPRTGSPLEGKGGADSPLDLSGGKPSDLPGDLPPGLHPFLNPGMLSLFNQFQLPLLAAAGGSSSGLSGPPAPGDLANLLSLVAQKSQQQQNVGPPKSSPTLGRSNNPWLDQWLLKSNLDNSSSSLPRPPSSGSSSIAADVFKCVFCKESYQTLEDLTKHMKEAKHHSFPGGPMTSMAPSMTSSPIRASSSASSPTSSAKPRDILKEQVPMPRKLVRGQDVWIGRADEQTRDILKCMGCGQSFRSLDLLTKHMQETQHYKKVISHDQLSSWKYNDPSGGSGSAGAGGSSSAVSAANKNPINSVLSCKVCQKGFGSLKELSEHMVRAEHFGPPPDNFSGASGLPALLRQGVGALPTSTQHNLSTPPSAKDRKKALPVKKLLELERARYEVMGGSSGPGLAGRSAAASRDILETGKLTCDRCQDKIPLELFISHVQQCLGQRPSPPGGSNSGKLEERMTGDDKKGGRGGDSSSILGSLEMMVKSNFMPGGSKSYQPPSSSPSLAASPVTATANKFSMASILPGQKSITPVSTSPSPVPSGPVSPPGATSSKPGSPASIRTTSPAGLQENGKDGVLDTKNQMDGVIASPLSFSNRSPLSCSNRSPTLSRSPMGLASDDDRSSNAVSPPVSSNGAFLLGARNENESKPLDNQPTSSGNPLMALQKLCDTQSKAPPPNSRSSTMKTISNPVSMMEFSWAVNQAVTNGHSGNSAAGDATNIKCPFCDTPFVSKGAYRHHLSKFHFPAGGGGGNEKSQPPINSPPPAEDLAGDSSIASKYAKYSQLAKQLSCNQK